MIARHWRALARSNEAQNYVEHLRTDTFPALRQIPGFVDASIEAIERFAGPDPEKAVVPANVVAMMLEYDERVKHFEVLD